MVKKPHIFYKKDTETTLLIYENGRRRVNILVERFPPQEEEITELKWGKPLQNENVHLDVDCEEEKVSELQEKIHRARFELTEEEYNEFIKEVLK